VKGAIMPETWLGWTTFHEADDLKLLGWVLGVYANRLLGANNKNPEEIGRLLRVDKAGILQIGVSKQLGKRLLAFFNSYLNGAHSHSEGERLCLLRLYTQFEHVYVESSLQYNTKWTPYIEQVRVEEERLLKSYFKRFGELPPLNNNMGNQRVRWMEDGVERDTLW
jgi:hypothetical protein